MTPDRCPACADLTAPCASCEGWAFDRARLLAFVADPSKPAAKRTEAEGVVVFVDARRADIFRRMELAVTVTPLGMLLRVPSATTPEPR